MLRRNLAGLKRYQRRLGKGYSLVDRTSMNAIRRLGIREILTDDRHFAQEGFRLHFESVLLRLRALAAAHSGRRRL